MKTPHGAQHPQFMSEQEKFWAGEFGSDYTARNRVEWEKRVPFWKETLALTEAQSVLDVGCNAGWNLHAIKAVAPDLRTVGIDINEVAVGEACANEIDARLVAISQAGILFHSSFDLVCTSGVLIHVAPEHLEDAMQSIVAASRRWVIAVEYDAPQEEEIVYRGNTDKLWKRPFGKLYEAMGLEVVAESDAQGFDQCRSWLMVKP